MNIKPISSPEIYEETLIRIEQLMDAEKGNVDEDELDILATLVDAYDAINFPVPLPNDSIGVLKFFMDQQGLSRKDLEPMLGSKGRVSEILNGKRELSLNQIRKLHAALRIPYELLIENEYGEVIAT